MATPYGRQTKGGSPTFNSPTNVTLLDNFIYIYQIPQMEKKRLAALLEVNNKWYELGQKQMGYSSTELDSTLRCCQRNNRSPAEVLLEKWANYNHTITELFVVLSHEKLYSCMEIIKRYVAPRYHTLIKQPLNEVLSPDGDTGAFSGAGTINNPRITNGRNCVPQAANDGTDKKANDVLVTPGAAAKNESIPLNSKINSPFANELADLSSLIPKVSYEELTAATENWSERNILGKGGFGTVYRGFFKYTYMAIKKIDCSKVKTSEAERIQLQQSFNELRFLNSCRHDNIVPLFGYSLDKEPCLVYQFMPGGSLDKSLFARRPAPILTWKDRMNIAIGTAKGLQYLHTFGERPFIHGDIKPGNILLNEHKQPRIGDFGLTREGALEDSAMVVTYLYGTRPYIPKEFLVRRELSTKLDTYSFGVVLFELGTGLRAWDERRADKHLKVYIDRAVHEKRNVSELMDKSIPIESAYDGLFCQQILSVGLLCTNDDPKQRPDMVTVMMHLNSALGRV